MLFPVRKTILWIALLEKKKCRWHGWFVGQKAAPASLTNFSFLWEAVKCAQYCTTVVNCFVYLEKFREMSELSDFSFEVLKLFCTMYSGK